MKLIKRFKILILMPILAFAIGCAASSTEWKIALYKPDATSAALVLDYKECDEPARAKGMLISGAAVDRYVFYEWLEKDRANILMIYDAQTRYTTTNYEKRKIFISEYGPAIEKCMEEKGWIKKDYRQGDGAVYPIYGYLE